MTNLPGMKDALTAAEPGQMVLLQQLIYAHEAQRQLGQLEATLDHLEAMDTVYMTCLGGVYMDAQNAVDLIRASLDDAQSALLLRVERTR